MPRSDTQPATQTQRGQRGASDLAQASLRVVDYSGRRRQGRAIVIVPHGSPDLVGARLDEGEDFRIVILAEPPEGLLSPAEGVVVAAPPRPLTSPPRRPAARGPGPAGGTATPPGLARLQALHPLTAAVSGAVEGEAPAELDAAVS